MVKAKFIPLLFITAVFSSCIVHAPKYTGIEEVLRLKVGMTYEEANMNLGISPYDIRSANDTGTTYIYKYRTTDRKTIPFLMNGTNGIKAKGKWVDLFVTYNNEKRISRIESCSECEEVKANEKKIDFNSIIMLVTVTLPAVLVYLGLSAQ